MAHLIVIVGLPGSGKTSFGKQFGLPHVEDLLTRSSGGLGDIIVDTVIDSVLLIVDVNRQRFQREAELFGHTTEWIFFENNPAVCKINIARTDRDKPVFPHTVDHFSRLYTIPEGARTVPCWTE